jgi:hypothetical protein
MKSPIKIITLITASAAAVALLAGCSAPLDLDIAVDTDGTPAVPVEVIEEITAEQLAADTAAGAALSETAAMDFNRERDLGVRGYQMPDDTWVAVRKDSPLPEPVKAVILTEIAAPVAVQEPGHSMGVTNAIGNAQYETGRRILVVAPIIVACEMWGPNIPAWAVYRASSPVFTSCNSKEEAIAFAQDRIAAEKDPAAWDLIIY